MPTPNRARKNIKAFAAESARDDHRGERDARPADDPAAPEAVGQPPHRQRAQDEEGAGGGGDDDDGGVAEAEGVADVRGEQTEGRGLQFVHRRQAGQRQERHGAAGGEALAERDVFAADAGQQFVGEQHLALRLGLAFAALGFGGDQPGGQVRRGGGLGGAVVDRHDRLRAVRGVGQDLCAWELSA
ncbi:hypothetical protein ACU686_27535 [Yinghuangia aomiensis]